MSAVYLPTAIIGNGQTLCTIGASGEIMGFFFPNIDHAQHIHECMLGAYASGYGYSWTFEPSWERQQSYIDCTNILRTRLFNRNIGIELTLTDFVPPKMPALVRLIEVRRSGMRHVHSVICHYFELWVDGHKWKNCVQAFPDERLILQWFRDTWIAVAATPFGQFQCGKSDVGAWSNAKDDLYDGSLKSQALEIGSVNFAIAWELPVGEMQKSIMLTMVAAKGRDEAVKLAKRLRKIAPEQLLSETRKHWREWVDGIEPPVGDEVFQRAYVRAYLTLPMLFDNLAGAPIAAPEFDPAFVASGGYGFCWLRDAAQMIELWLMHGKYEPVAKFIRWASSVQMEDGSWLQRYWLNGHLGPAWSTGDENLQWDQVASMVILACECYRRLDSFSDDGERLSRMLFTMALKGARSLCERFDCDISSGKVPIVGMDLWETFSGSFVYTNAAVHKALLSTSELARRRRKRSFADKCVSIAMALKGMTLQKMVSNGHLVRGVSVSGQIDKTIDSSALGAIVPYGMLSLSDGAELGLAINTVEAVTKEAGVSVAGRKAIARYVGDLYAGGMACVVSTLWAGMAMLHIADKFISLGEIATAKAWLERAEELIYNGASFTTPAGIYCELFGLDGFSYWAPGHSWASVWVIRAIDKLAQVRKRLAETVEVKAV